MNTDYFFELDGPLDSVPTERQMRIANLTGFQDLIRNFGADPRAILERHDIDPQAIRDPDHYVDCKSVVDVFEYCSTLLNHPLFGLQLAQVQERATRAINQIAEAEKFDLVVQEAVFASSRIDITDKVIRALADK